MPGFRLFAAALLLGAAAQKREPAARLGALPELLGLALSDLGALGDDDDPLTGRLHLGHGVRLGVARVQTGEVHQAESLLTRAAAIFTNAFGANHARTAQSMSDLGELYRRNGKMDQARAYHHVMESSGDFAKLDFEDTVATEHFAPPESLDRSIIDLDCDGASALVENL